MLRLAVCALLKRLALLPANDKEAYKLVDTEFTPPPPPEGIGENARELWDWLMEFQPEPHEVALIRECIATVELIDQLDEAVQRDGPVVESPQGVKAHPAVVEGRQQRLALARLIAALRIPEDEDSPAQRLQRRPIRGVYAIDGGRR